MLPGMNDHHKATLLNSAENTRTIARLLVAAGIVGVVLALVLALIALDAMSGDSFGDPDYTTSAKLTTVAIVGFGTGMPSLLLIGLGHLLTVSAVWFEVQGEKPAPGWQAPPASDAGTI